MARSSDPTGFTLAEARDALAAKDISARELAQAHVDAVVKARPLNAFITETPDHALSRAAQSDARIAAGEARPLEGIPLAIKDLFCTQGVRTTAASRASRAIRRTVSLSTDMEPQARSRQVTVAMLLATSFLTGKRGWPS